MVVLRGRIKMTDFS